jgi:hypothetical protein
LRKRRGESDTIRLIVSLRRDPAAMHGTGKFAGITGEGKSKIVDVISRTPEKMVACSHSTGTYQMK